jgi:dihydroflavonol-4-reductase
MKIAVTGASGHVGGNLCRELLKQGHQVKALVHKETKSLEGLDLDYVRGDINDADMLQALCQDAEVVVHLAAKISVNGNKRSLEETNVEGTKNLLEAVWNTNVRRLIHFSSIHALDHQPLDQPMDESRSLVKKTLMQYEATKTASERLVSEYVKRGLDAVIMNPTAIIGPYDFKPSLVGQVLIRLYNGSLPALVPGGYDWVDVRDVCKATITTMTKGKSGERYILSGGWLSVKDLALLMEEATGKRMVRFMVPLNIAKIGVPFIKLIAWMTHSHPLYTYQSLDVLMEGNRMINNQKSRDVLGFRPRPLKETLIDTIQWYKENNMLK